MPSPHDHADRRAAADRSFPPGAAGAPTPASTEVPLIATAPRRWRHGLALSCVIAVGLVLQWPGLDNEVLERVHGWRQTQTAMTARNFVRDGMNPLVARVDYMGDGQMQLELPLYQYLVALCYCVFGIAELAGRLVALAFGAGSAVMMYTIGRTLWNPRTGLAAAAAFCWAPVNLFFNRAIMPDSCTIFLSLACLRAFLAWSRDPRRGRLIAACALLALTLAGKPPIALAIAPPLVVTLMSPRGPGGRNLPTLLIGLLAAGVAFGAWMKYASFVNHHRSDTLIRGSFTNAGEFNEDLVAWYFGTWEERIKWPTYRRILERAHEWAGHPALLLLGIGGLAGLAARGRRWRDWLLAAWVVGALAYVLTFLHVNLIHNYYQMPIIPPLALACAVGWDRAVACCTRLFARPVAARVFGGAAALAFAGLLVAGSVRVLRDYNPVSQTWGDHPRQSAWEQGGYSYWRENDLLIGMGRDIARALPPSARRIALAGNGYVADVRDPQMMYYLDRRGFIIQSPDEYEKELQRRGIPLRRRGPLRDQWVAAHLTGIVNDAVAKGLDTLIVVNPAGLLSDATWRDLSLRFRRTVGDRRARFVIFSLAPPARQ